VLVYLKQSGLSLRLTLAAPLPQCMQIGGHRLIADAGFI
jgi:hypothetical protein